jgi:hypothetical protein
MPTKATERELLTAMEQLLIGNPRGLTIIQGDCGGIVIERRGHVRGIWRCLDGSFAWTPSGYNEPVHVSADIPAVLTYTQTVILGA